MRYNANGTLDTTFNGTGTVVTHVGAGVNFVYALALQPDGKLVLAGACDNGTTYVFCALRYSANGTLDTSFGAGGTVSTPMVTNQAYAYALAVQPDGKLVLAGECSSGGNFDFCALRYNVNGTLDTNFNGSGKVVTPLGSGEDRARGLVLQPDGKLLIVGSCSNGTNYDFCSLRYHANGTLDTSFNGVGTVITPMGTGNDIVTAVALQPDGKLVLAGYCANGANDDFCALRYDGGPFGYQNCKPDIDGDGSFLATTDALINMRIALGITGNAVISGITFPPTATRNTWPLIRDYLVTQCGMSLVQ